MQEATAFSSPVVHEKLSIPKFSEKSGQVWANSPLAYTVALDESPKIARHITANSLFVSVSEFAFVSSPIILLLKKKTTREESSRELGWETRVICHAYK